MTVVAILGHIGTLSARVPTHIMYLQSLLNQQHAGQAVKFILLAQDYPKMMNITLLV